MLNAACIVQPNHDDCDHISFCRSSNRSAIAAGALTDLRQPGAGLGGIMQHMLPQRRAGWRRSMPEIVLGM